MNLCFAIVSVFFGVFSGPFRTKRDVQSGTYVHCQGSATSSRVKQCPTIAMQRRSVPLKPLGIARIFENILANDIYLCDCEQEVACCGRSPLCTRLNTQRAYVLPSCNPLTSDNAPLQHRVGLGNEIRRHLMRRTRPPVCSNHGISRCSRARH